MKSDLAILKSEILRDMEKLEHLFEKFASSFDKYKARKEYAFLVESAFYVNQVYTGFERIFQNIAAFFINTFQKLAKKQTFSSFPGLSDFRRKSLMGWGRRPLFENNVDEKSWHKSLLDRTVLDIENIRPPVISESNYRHLDELRAFRHFFRHTYDFDLEEEKFSIVASKARELRKGYKADLEKFLQFIRGLATPTKE